MEHIAEHPLEENLADVAAGEDYPDKVLIASIMGTNEEDWENWHGLLQKPGQGIEMNLSCPQMTSHAMGSDVGNKSGTVPYILRSSKKRFLPSYSGKDDTEYYGYGRHRQSVPGRRQQRYFSDQYSQINY